MSTATQRSRTASMVFPRIIVSGVGTGGHYFPAVVTALELQKRGFEVVFLARRGCREEEIARKCGLSIFVTKARPFYGKSLVDKLLFIVTLMRTVLRLNALTSRAIGLAFGGFGAVPLNISCILNRSDFYIFEPNRVPGRATRFFASAARRVFLGMPPVSSLPGKVLITGIPLRPEFKRHRRVPGGKMHKRTIHVLIYGGSQGASRLNDLALELSGSMPRRWRLTVIAGSRDYQRLLGKRIMNTRVIPFTETPWREIDRADIVVSRAGALAGYELMACNRRVIFIPFPFAIDRHQYHNASYFAAIGDAAVCEEKDLTAPQLSDRILKMLRTKNLKKTHMIMDAEQRIVSCIVRDVAHEEK